MWRAVHSTGDTPIEATGATLEQAVAFLEIAVDDEWNEAWDEWDDEVGRDDTPLEIGKRHKYRALITLDGVTVGFAVLLTEK